MPSSLQKHEFTANGNSVTFSHPGGRFIIARHQDTTISAGTTKVQFSTPDNENWEDIPSASLTDSGVLDLVMPTCRLRVNLASIGGSGSIWTYYQFYA